MFKGIFNRMIYGRSDKPDLTPEDMSKNKFQLFFEILGVRFWDLCKLNLLLVIFMIPAIAWTSINLNVFMNPEIVAADLLNYQMIYLLGMIPCFLIMAPGISGMNYVIRKYASDEHAWLWSDFKEQAKANWKQSVLYMLIIGVSLYLGFVVLRFYNSASQGNMLMYFMRTFFIVLFALYLMSSMYVFPLMVTYKLKLRQILKNSVIFAMVRPHFTILFSVIVLFPAILLLLISFYWQYAVIGLFVYYLIFGFAFSAYIINFYTRLTFQKYITSEDEASAPSDEQDSP